MHSVEGAVSIVIYLLAKSKSGDDRREKYVDRWREYPAERMRSSLRKATRGGWSLARTYELICFH